ncbi:hypothetical protein [Bacillus cereus]|uniref:hypothetical protein n=1 Tax=Bacillus cereus TaxID=1396 RepID=UPI000BF29C6A|nr:hypothetical protein [Bacillus cereus]PFV39490.1 hypothetical protein COL00_27060 [Bacillus cereus]PGQ05642.1 hypothetical protein COA09_26730 [Bacillus cereus]PGS48623.1 hypothetical protein COC67_28935 [Bacillus cereus]PGU90627.1 hypothetical protein COD77_30180 [Bacillus cereus]
MKKTMKNILVGFALLSGIVMAGGNSASAAYTDTANLESQYFAPFKDANGNKVSLGREYYMEPVDFPGQGLKYEQWGTNEWAKLDSGRGRAVTFENVQYGVNGLNSLVKIKTDSYEIEIDDTIGVSGGFRLPLKYYMYLGAGLNAEGVELRELMSDRNDQNWVPIQSYIPDLASTNTIVFKNEKKNKFLSYRNSNDWLNVNQPTINSKTKWRLIPKQ